MSCLNLRRLLPPKKVWKLFTNKLQIKLHILNRSKAIKKPKKASKKLARPSLSIQPKKFKVKPNSRALIHHHNHHYYIQKRPAPVYVDQLFIEPVSIVTEHLSLPEQEPKKEKVCSSSVREKSGIPKQSKRQPENSKEETTVEYEDHRESTADDMWESLDLASPHDINERAEEFIASFRAEMQQQEMLARRL